MRRLLLPLLLLVLVAGLLVACGDGIRKRVFPPTASVQELAVQPDGRWALKLRLQNFSNVAMRFDALDATLHVGEIEVGQVTLAPALSVPGNSVEVLDATIAPPAAATSAVTAVLQSRAGIRYRLVGRIRSSDPQRRDDEFTFESSLSAVPGLSGVLR